MMSMTNKRCISNIRCSHLIHERFIDLISTGPLGRAKSTANKSKTDEDDTPADSNEDNMDDHKGIIPMPFLVILK